MKTVSVENSVGMVLAHDLTQIVPGEFKGSRFRKGHIVQEIDIPTLLSMGKENIYVLELEQDDLHEDEAGMRIALSTAGDGIQVVAKNEGKVELVAKNGGLLKVDIEKLYDLIDDDEIMYSTLHTNQMVEQGEVVAGTRIIPLYIKEDKVKRVENVCKDSPLIRVCDLKKFKIGLVTTGSEVFNGRIKDAFGPVLIKKYENLGSEVVKQVFCDDDDDMIAKSILELIKDGMNMIAVTGGMSVDPDDRTPSGIRKTGCEIISYGAPVLPGAMFLLAYYGEIPIVGLPGCVMYHKTSIFDLIIPRILVGEKLTKADIKKLVHGGLCRGCEVCYYPNCSFGK